MFLLILNQTSLNSCMGTLVISVGNERFFVGRRAEFLNLNPSRPGPMSPYPSSFKNSKTQSLRGRVSLLIEPPSDRSQLPSVFLLQPPLPSSSRSSHCIRASSQVNHTIHLHSIFLIHFKIKPYNFELNSNLIQLLLIHINIKLCNLELFLIILMLHYLI